MSAMRRYLCPPRALLLSAIALAGCSGAEDQDVLLRGAASSSGTVGPGSSSGSSGASSGTPGGTSGSTPSNCTPEEEPNDREEQANTLAPARCGTLSNDDERDYLTFQLKPTTKTMSLRFDGNVRLRVEVDGREVADLTPQNAGVVPFQLNATYLIEVRPLGDARREVPWRVEVIEN